jgi:hypothetical protein
MSRMISAAAVAAFVLTGTAFAQTAPQAAPAPATSERLFLGISAGALMNTNLVTTQGESSLYGQTALAAERRDVSGGILFDVMAAVPIRGRWGAGVDVNFRTLKSDSAIAATIPHPVFSDSPRTITTTSPGLSHTETWVSLLGVYTPQGSSKVTLRLYGGPAVAMVQHDTIGSFTAAEGSTITQPTITITKGSASKNVIGGTGGADIAYRVNEKLSLGVFLRYSGAMANIAGTESKLLGGLSAGGGLRFSFAKK